MANKKFTDLLPADALPTLTGTDILAVTVDPNGATPVSNKTTIANLMGQAPVQSVNTATGAVVLDADDIDDSSTSHKFVTASDITNLGNLSGTNTGDQDLSALATQVSLGNHEALTSLVHGISAFGATLVDDADAATARTTLGLGTAATTASTDYATEAQGALADSALQSLAAGALSDFDFDDNAIFGFAAKVETPTITANAYTLVAADNGKVLALDNGATAMTLNVDTGLPASFNCSFIQKGAGQVTFAGTATVNNRQSHTKINGQYGVASIVAYDTDTYILAGDTAS